MKPAEIKLKYATFEGNSIVARLDQLYNVHAARVIDYARQNEIL